MVDAANLRKSIIDAATVVSLNSVASSNTWGDSNSFRFSQLVGTGVKSEIRGNSIEDLSKLKEWLSDAKDVVLGYFSFEMKNILENLASINPDQIGFPLFHFFIPETVFIVKDDAIECHTHAQNLNTPINKELETGIGSKVGTQIDRSEYISKVLELKKHIQLGDIYEVNYCVEHAMEDITISPYALFEEMQKVSPAPYSCYVADEGKFLLSSSPERFLKKEGMRLVSQPMKGTNRRLSENELQMKTLRNDPKEVSENVMITDLVRNDLSKSATKGTVNVDELCGVYTFKHVNQMISTVSAELREDVHPLDAILNAFPMGSMTGAPKIRAMELIDQYESFSRGLYSGAVGYFTPDLDFDFNVVIRSILYNEEKKIATFPTGGAITINSDPEAEYEECMLKAEAMRNALMNHVG